MKRSAPAAQRNRGPIADVLAEWLPAGGLVLEVASGTGEHSVYFAERFQDLRWQPSDADPAALESIEAWRIEATLPNMLPPVVLDASAKEWPIAEAAAVLSINMTHISPWSATLGLLDGAAKLLPADGSLIFYGPWIVDDIPTAPSNLEFDASLRARNPERGIRSVADLKDAARDRNFDLVERRAMPANNFMLLLRRIKASR